MFAAIPNQSPKRSNTGTKFLILPKGCMVDENGCPWVQNVGLPWYRTAENIQPIKFVIGILLQNAETSRKNRQNISTSSPKPSNQCTSLMGGMGK
jgi:hypothetical protein